MKKSKTFALSIVLIMLFGGTALAQSNAKVIAVVNHASWCPTCVGNGERAQTVFAENNKDHAIQFVVNDLSTEETKQKSADELKNLGLLEAMEAQNKTGIAYFFDAGTKALINQISVAKTNDEIAATMKNATEGLK